MLQIGPGTAAMLRWCAPYIFQRNALLVLVVCLLCTPGSVLSNPGTQEVSRDAEQAPLDEALIAKLREACPDYTNYARIKHLPFSEGPMQIPFQRPHQHCRTFSSPLVEQVIQAMNEKMVDKDLARIFENAFPNTLDTTVRWHVDGSDQKKKTWGLRPTFSEDQWQGAQSFIVTGDINAEWLRDSTNQLAQYQTLAKKDKKINSLILGAINTQAEYVIGSPYCNAFQPPAPSKIGPTYSGSSDQVHPAYEPSFVFECKYELDSLAHFLSLANQFYEHTGSTEFLTPRWYKAVENLLATLEEQSRGTFDDDGKFQGNQYTFQRQTNVGTETLGLAGIGNPLNNGTGLVRSAFRPSDDATTLGFLIPANAMISVELKRTAAILKKNGKSTKLAKVMQARADIIRAGIFEHAVVSHKKYGKVFAFEVDGYGSSILMDDANIPSLLALPLLGFVAADDETYQNTRKMILEKQGNPYYLTGPEFSGIGGPHIGLQNAWPMSVLVQAMTSDDDKEISKCIELVKTVSGLGLIHESVNVDFSRQFTRSWFAWANSVFAQTVLDLAKRKPHLLFGPGAKPYTIE